MKLHTQIVILNTSLLIGIVGGLGQSPMRYDAEAEKMFSAAVLSFQNGQYDEAALQFEQLIAITPPHQRTTASYIMGGKAYYRLQEFNKSISLIQNLFRKYPETNYIDDAHFILGLNYIMLKHYEESAQEFVRCLDVTQDKKLMEKASTLFEAVADKHLDIVMLFRLEALPTRIDLKDLVGLKLAEKYYEKVNFARAKEILSAILKREQPSPYVYRAWVLFDKIERGRSVKIGVLLPLMLKSSSSEIQVLANEILEGIQFALSEYRKKSVSSLEISLEVRNTERDSAIAISAVKELSGMHNVVALIGPLFSNIVRAVASIANMMEIPLVSPTANATGVAALGPYIFQLNPDIATRGKSMARFAVQQLGLRTLAVLANNDSTPLQLALCFIDEAQRLGATVLTVETYSSDSSDLRQQFMNIRRSAVSEEPHISFAGTISPSEVKRILEAGADSLLVDSLIKTSGSLGVTKLFGPDGHRLADSLHVTLVYPYLISEILDTPITSVEGLFVAISTADEIGIIGSQLAFSNVQTQLLGDSEWYDLVQLEANKQYVRDIIFISDYYVQKDESTYVTFEASFINALRKPPTKYTLFGYDAMNLILDQLSSGQTNRVELAKALSDITLYKGLHSNISLKNGRVNSALHILQYLKGDVKKIGESSVE